MPCTGPGRCRCSADGCSGCNAPGAASSAAPLFGGRERDRELSLLADRVQRDCLPSRGLLPHRTHAASSAPSRKLTLQDRREAKAAHVIMLAWTRAALGELTPAEFQGLLDLAPEAVAPSHAGNYGRLLQIALYLEVRPGAGRESFICIEGRGGREGGGDPQGIGLGRWGGGDPQGVGLGRWGGIGDPRDRAWETGNGAAKRVWLVQMH